jgi:predicted permease
MLQRILRILRRGRFESDLDAELRDHMQKYRDDLVSRGVPAQEAELRARREFGRIIAVKEDVRESSGLAWADTAARNFRYAFRVLRKNPTFAFTAILTLALCIGANTAIFTVVDAMLFRPLPYPEPDRLARISVVTRHAQGEDEETSVDGKTWEYLRDRVRSLDMAVHALPQPVNLVASGAAQHVQQLRVSSGFFRVLGVKPFMGREIDPEEDRPGAAAVVVLSHGLWIRALGSDPSIIGKKIVLRGEPFTVVGVMPEGFNSRPPADLWTPLQPSTTGEGGGSNYGLLTRVRPEYDIRQAQAELNLIESSPDAQPRRQPGVSVSLRLVSVQRATADDRQLPLGEPLLLLWAAVGVVLLIGCVNVAGLMLARGDTRRHEIATRLALGSSRHGVLAQLLSESLLLAAAGGAVGLAFGYGALIALQRLAAQPLELTQPINIDLRVLAVTGASALLASILAGLYPAWRTARMDIRDALATAGRTLSGHRRPWVRQGLVVSEVALGMVLLVAFGLVLKTLANLKGLSPGYDGRDVLTASLPLQDARYSTSAAVNQLYDAGLARIREYPGVEAAGVGLTLPYQRALNDGIRIIDGPRATPQNRSTNVTYVTPGYFEALRFRMVRGRLFTDSDRSGSQPVAIINEAFARRFLKDDDPLGRHLGQGREIIGIVGDVQQVGFGDPVAPIPNLYLPAAQIDDGYFQLVHTWFAPSWVVRGSGPQSAIAAAMRTGVASVDPLLPFADFQTMDEIRDRAFGLQRLESVLLGALAGLALLLSAVGIFGLIAQTVVERTREFGIRLALGASVGRTISSAARPGILLSAAGIAIGFVLARLAGRLFQALIYHVEATDTMTFTLVAITLLGVATLASLLPSLRIARLDPATTLREE